MCPEKNWPYHIDKFTVKPTDACYQIAHHHHAVQYHRVNQNQKSICAVLQQNLPIIFGFLVYPSFEVEEVAKTGIVPLPQKGEKSVGGHAVAIVGYQPSSDDSDESLFIVRNSWGEDWGDKGYCYFPESYILNPDLAFDFWVVQKVENSQFE